MPYSASDLIHHYFGVDYSLVWNIVQENIQELETQLKRILEEAISE